MPDNAPSFKPTLGLLDATMIVAGSMIGSGIFIVSTEMTNYVGSSGWLILAWVVAGFLTVAAAVSYGELSAMFPKAGGQYVYLREAFGPLTGFLYGWSLFAVIQTGTIAAVGVAFSKFAAYIFPALGPDNLIIDFGITDPDHPLLKIGLHGISAAQLVSLVMVVLLTYINTKGVEGGKKIQTVFTITKLLSLFGLIIFGLVLAASPEIWNANWTNAWEAKRLVPETGEWKHAIGLAVAPLFASALVGSIFSSDAWNNVTFIAGEIKKPEKNIGLSLFLGTLIVTIIFIATNLMYLSVLSLNEIATAPDGRVSLAAAIKIFGGAGASVIAVMIMISTFGCNNGLILSGARVYYTMAKDKLFFKEAGRLNKHNVPAFALWTQGVWTCLLCLSGTYNQLLTYVVFVVVIFYALTLLGIFRLRKKRPDLPRPYKAFGYPLLPIIYCVMAFLICGALFVYQPMQTWPGALIVLLGIPLYYFVVRRKR
ncbi:MAG: amino acid permease [Chitinophagaceae bacterium]|nr:amino acid permease [Chitinophagaceae bacterium]